MSRRYARRGTGSARKRNGRWEVRRQINRQSRAFRGDTLADAQSLAQAAARQPPPTVATTTTVRDWLAEWLARKKTTVRSQAFFSYEAHARLHIVPVIGQVRLDLLTPAHIDKLYARLLRTVGGTTARHVHVTLFAALNAAERRGCHVSQDLRGVEPPRRTPREIEALTCNEVEQLVRAARGDPFEAAYILEVTLGMREGELLGLRWTHIDLPGRRLTVVGNATRALDGSRVITPPKTKAGRRSLRLPAIAVGALMRTPREPDSDLVWPGPNGQPWPEQRFGWRWMAMRKRAGIRPVTFHALRHTAATLALEDGMSPHVVAAMLGHASVATTLSLYAHATDASQVALVDAIDARYGPRLRVVAGSELEAELDAGDNPMAKTASQLANQWCRGRDAKHNRRRLITEFKQGFYHVQQRLEEVGVGQLARPRIQRLPVPLAA